MATSMRSLIPISSMSYLRYSCLRSWALVMALLVASLLPGPFAIEVFTPPPPKAEEAPIFGGKDVFGRTPACRACHALLSNLGEKLMPTLRSMRVKEHRRRAAGTSASRRVDFGKFEGVIMDEVPRGCKFSSTYHNRDLRKACEALVEGAEDAIVGKYYEWSQRPLQPGELEGGGREGAGGGREPPPPVPGQPYIPPFRGPGGGEGGAGDGWNWNLQVCYKATKACPVELAMHALEDFADDGSGQADRPYRSEHRPAIGTREGEVLTVVAASFYELVVRPAGRDVLAYFSFPATHAASHAIFGPVFEELALLLAANGTAPVDLARVDADVNDVPPPYGSDIKAPTLALYRANNKGTPTYITTIAGGEVSIYDVLYFLLTSSGDRQTSALAAHLIQTLDYDLLYKVPDPADQPRRQIPVEVTPRGRAKRAKASAGAEDAAALDGGGEGGAPPLLGGGDGEL